MGMYGTEFTSSVLGEETVLSPNPFSWSDLHPNEGLFFRHPRGAQRRPWGLTRLLLVVIINEMFKLALANASRHVAVCLCYE